jgi:membrane protease YdiL (CAAX protease family)
VLIPPALILLVLTVLRALVGDSFRPNFFPLGFSFGIAAGLLEEIGWTGYLFPRLRALLGWKRASVLLGFLWGFWHLPVADYLGAAAPHASAWPAFFLAFVLIVSAMRVIICWAVTRTRSVLIAMLIHISSTGSLVMFAPLKATAAQEARWYGVYGAAVWLVAGAILASMAGENRA